MLDNIIWTQDPAVVFLAEIWLDKARLVVIRDGLQFGGYHGVLKISRGIDLAPFLEK